MKFASYVDKGTTERVFETRFSVTEMRSLGDYSPHVLHDTPTPLSVPEVLNRIYAAAIIAQGALDKGVSVYVVDELLPDIQR